MRLLATKLFLPPLRPSTVQRDRLLDRLDDVLRPGARLALISAPAGFGKTSLLAGWLHRLGRPAAWLSLDAGDQQPTLFLAYLLAALERACPNCVPETAALLRSLPAGEAAPPAATLLDSLINELSALETQAPLVIALDDFQFVTSADVREAVHYFVEHLPPGVRLAIATRSDPPLPLARMRARGELVELRAADLRFSTAEAAALLASLLRVEQALPATAIQELATRTEGWAAGLQMAALALHAAPDQDAAHLAQTFSGSHRFILDYLAEEVLSRLPEPTLNFLLQTSILERFNAAACAAVAHEAFDSPSPASAQALLSELEHANLFLVPLDGERQWFRYHHLFADLLRARLKAERPAEIAALHARAAAWFETQGATVEAIRHTLAAGEAGQPEAFDHAAHLVEQNTLPLMRRGELHAILSWMQLLPDQISLQRPWLAVYRAWTQVFRGNVPALAPLLEQAQARRSALPPEQQTELDGHIAAIRCHAALLAGDIPAIAPYAAETARHLPDPRQWARGLAIWPAGYAARLRGDLEGAARAFAEQFAVGLALGDPWGTAMNATDLGLTRRTQGRLREALDVFTNCLAMLETQHARGHGYTARLLTALALARYDRNELEQARSLLEEALALTRRWRNPNHQVFAHLNMARVLAATAEFSAAQDQIEQAEAQLREMPLVPNLVASVRVARASLRLAQGIAPSSAELDELQHRLPPGAPVSEAVVIEQNYAIRALLARGDATSALPAAVQMRQAAEASGRVFARIEFLVLEALAQYRLANSDAALAALETAAALAEPETILRPFLDLALLPNGATALAQMLDGLRRRSPARRAFAERLLAESGVPQTEIAPVPAARSSTALIEPLSEREIEVLRLLADGLTNAQIAARLILSIGTVKAHTANIFRKLDAANRTQAVALAREMGIIS